MPQKTLLGYTAREILAQCREVKTIGGGMKRVFCLPRGRTTRAHFTLVSESRDQIVVQSGLIRRVVAIR